MPKPKGGRGHKAEYESTHVRVPLPIKSDVQKLIERFYSEEELDEEKTLTGLEEATVIARSILSQKKSSRISMSKLLTAIYGENIEL